MTKEQFDQQTWHKGMNVKVDSLTETQGVIAVDFELRRIGINTPDKKHINWILSSDCEIIPKI